MEKIEKWRSELAKITDDVRSQFGHLTDDQLNWRPNPDTWSIAQNLNHLVVTNETYFPVLTSLKKGTYKTPLIAKIGFIVSFLGKTILKAVEPERLKKMKTFPIWEPSKSEIGKDIVVKFEAHQEVLMMNIESAKELVAKGIIISSPANGNIVYTLETAFDIIINHEKRHLNQAKEVLALLKSLN